MNQPFVATKDLFSTRGILKRQMTKPMLKTSTCVKLQAMPLFTQIMMSDLSVRTWMFHHFQQSSEKTELVKSKPTIYREIMKIKIRENCLAINLERIDSRNQNLIADCCF